MCYFIDSELLLANIFSNKVQEYTISDIINVKNESENELTNVFIDLSSSSVFSTIEYYPDMFAWTGQSIVSKNYKEYFNERYLEYNFNRKLPQKIKAEFLEILKSEKQRV